MYIEHTTDPISVEGYDDTFLDKLQEIRFNQKETLLMLEQLYAENHEGYSSYSSTNGGDDYNQQTSYQFYKNISDTEIDKAEATDKFSSTSAIQEHNLGSESSPQCLFCSCPVDCQVCGIDFQQNENERLTMPTPSITIPEPFWMTIREEYKQESRNNYSSYHQSFDADYPIEEFSRFKANPVPLSTYMPRYQQMVNNWQNRKQTINENSKNLLKMVKPFNLTKSKTHLHSRRCSSMQDISSSEVEFHAQPVPTNILTENFKEETAKQEIARNERIKRRSLYLLETSYSPINNKISSEKDQSRHTQCINEEHHFQRARQIPNFKKLHQKMENQLLEAKLRNVTSTVCQPMKLATTNRQRMTASGTTNVKSNNNNRNKNTSSLYRCTSSPNLLSQHQFQNIRSNVITTHRYQLMQEKIKNETNQSIKQMTRIELKKQKQIQFQKHLHLLAKHRKQYAERKQTIKLNELKSSLKRRSDEYKDEVAAMQTRINERPTLIERQNMLIIKQRIEKRLETALQNAGISDLSFLTDDNVDVDEEVVASSSSQQRANQLRPRLDLPLDSDENSSDDEASYSARKRAMRPLRVTTEAEQGEVTEQEEDNQSSASTSPSSSSSISSVSTAPPRRQSSSHDRRHSIDSNQPSRRTVASTSQSSPNRKSSSVNNSGSSISSANQPLKQSKTSSQSSSSNNKRSSISSSYHISRKNSYDIYNS